MDISEKILNLRKAHNLTQEQLAEQLNVTRQTISKWESSQATPELAKIVQLSNIFNISTDQLLKPIEVDSLSIKTDILEQQQNEIRNIIEKKGKKKCIIYTCLAIYLISFAIIMIINQLSWEVDFLWNVLPGLTLPIIVFLISTAIALLLCIKINKSK